MSEKQSSVGVLGIAATFVGTVIGAGYASGQEVLQYFVFFGPSGAWAIVLAGVLFFATGWFATALGRKLRTSEYQKVVTPFNIKAPQYFCDAMILFSLVGTFVIMIAGNSANFHRQFNMPLYAGGVILVVLCILNLMFGLRGLVLMQSLLVPSMVAVAIGVSLYSLLNPVTDGVTDVVVNSSPMINNWFMAGVLYVSFNAQLAIAVLVPIGNEGRSSVRTLILGTLLGGFFLGLGAMVEYLALISNASIAGTATLPMVELAARISPALQFIYTVILFFGLYSTAISCLFGAYERIGHLPKMDRIGQLPLLTIIGFACFVASFVGFTKLVGYLYPALGYGGIIIMALLTWTYFKKVGWPIRLDPDPEPVLQEASA